MEKHKLIVQIIIEEPRSMRSTAARQNLNPQELYSIQGTNTEIGLKNFFEIASILDSLANPAACEALPHGGTYGVSARFFGSFLVGRLIALVR